MPPEPGFARVRGNACLNCQQAIQDCESVGNYWNTHTCFCEQAECPIAIDVAGNGFDLTSSNYGVAFDINGDGFSEQLSWTSQGTVDAWLALDRDGNGTIENGRELFGNFTYQPDAPAGEKKNGFFALAVFDRPEFGGNNDGVIDENDSVFGSLTLWQDANHNGLSERAELHALPELGIAALHLDFKESKWVDANGNRFRYRAKVDDGKSSNVNRWA